MKPAQKLSDNPIYEYPLERLNSHLFMVVDDQKWLIDSGSPVSFGEVKTLSLNGRSFEIAKSALGTTSQSVSRLVGVPCVGLIGGDILNQFDWLFDLPSGRIMVSYLGTDMEKDFPSLKTVQVASFGDIPVLKIQIGSESMFAFFDTGAQLSYLQPKLLNKYPKEKIVEDFHPAIGPFLTLTHRVPILLAEQDFSLACGNLPNELSFFLNLTGVTAVIGNEIFLNRQVWYSPAQNLMGVG